MLQQNTQESQGMYNPSLSLEGKMKKNTRDELLINISCKGELNVILHGMHEPVSSASHEE
jgi:hypothetical protein